MTQSMIIDISLLNGYLDNLGGEIVDKMIGMYVEQSVIYLHDISSATTEDRQQEWQSFCHKMKGAAGSVGMSKVHAKLVEIEKSTVSKENKEVFLRELSILNEEAISSFKQWLGTA